jgi:hypothetical protein
LPNPKKCPTGYSLCQIPKERYGNRLSRRELLNQSKALLKQSEKLVRQMQKIIDEAKKPDLK